MDDSQWIDSMLIAFDEMGFMPTTLLPDPEKARAEWKANLVAAIEKMDDKNASLAAKNEALTRSCDNLVRTLEEEREELRAAQDEAKRATEHNKTLTFTIECFQKTLAEHEAYITGLQNYRLERFATELSKKLCEFLDENEDNAGKIDKAIFLIDVIGVTAKDGTVISKGIIDKVMEEFTNNEQREAERQNH